MPPSRRTTLRLVGTSALALVSGCTASGLTSNDEETDQSNGNDGATFEARLTGPDADRLLYDETGVAKVGSIHERNGSFSLPVTLTNEAAATVSDVFRTAGVDDTPRSFAVSAIHNGQKINEFGIGPALAENVAEGEWDGEMRLTFKKRGKATEIRELLSSNQSE